LERLRRDDDDEGDRDEYIQEDRTARYNDCWVPVYRLAAQDREDEGRRRGVGAVAEIVL
jgi:hypothetical protein